MLKRLTSDLDEVYSSARPIMVAMRELASAATPEAMIDTLRERVLGDEIDRVTIVQIGFGSSGEAVTEAIAVSDYRGIGLDDDVPSAIRMQLGRKPLVISNLKTDATASPEVRDYARQTIRAASLSIFPLIGHDRTVGYLTIATNRPHAYVEHEVQTLEMLAAQAATVLDNLFLLNALSRKTEALDLVVSLSRSLAGTLHIDTVGAQIVKSLSAVYPIAHLSISLYQADSPTAQTMTFKGTALPDQIDWKGTLLEKAISNHQPIVETGDFGPADAALWHQAGADTMVVAPLRTWDRTLGTLNVGLEKSSQPAYIDSAIYEQVAEQIADVLENARTFERLQESLEETTSLYSTSLALNSVQNLQEAYETSLSELALVSEADRIRLYVAGPDPHGDVVYLEEAAIWEDRQTQIPESGQRYPVEAAPVLGQFPFSRASLIFNDLSDDKRLSEETRSGLQSQGIYNLMMIPITTGATWIGALVFETQSGMPFSSDQARVCRNVADQAALVIGSQILLARAQQAAVREHALVNTSSVLSSSLNPDYLLNSVLDNLDEVIPHDAANIMVIEEGEAKALVMRGYAAQGIDEAKLLELRIPPDAVDNLRTMRDQRKTVVISDTANYEDWVETPETAWVKSYIGAPIFIEDHLIGFLNLDSATPGFFTQQDATLLQAFADQFGLAYQNAQLFQKSRLRAQREQILGDIAGRLQTASTMGDVLETAARSIQAVLGDYDVSLHLAPSDAESGQQVLTTTAEEGRE